MKNYLKHIIGCLLLGAAVSCSDAPDELTETNYGRLFSPTELGVRIKNQVDATVSWAKVDKAAAYLVELYAGQTLSNAPVRTDEVSETTITYSELNGESHYFVRVQAVGDGIPASKWTETTFKTDAEQILEPVAADDLKATEVTLRWPAGKEATTIVLEPGNIVYTITPEDIATGAATIGGLQSETTYTAVMKLGEQTRGTVTFTTPIDLGDAVILRATNDEAAIQAFFAGLDEGASVCLLPAEDGTNTFPAVTVPLTRACTVMGLATQPVICGFAFSVEGAGNVIVKDLTFNNADAAENTPFMTILSMASGADLTLENCTLQGSKYKNLLAEHSNSQTSALHQLTVVNCLVTGTADRCIDFQKKKINFQAVRVANSTFHDLGQGKDFIRFDYTPERKDVVYTVENNTLYNVHSTDKGLLYIRSASKDSPDYTCHFRKNVVAFDADVANVFFCTDSKCNHVVFADNYYFNAASLTNDALPEAKGVAYDTGGTVLTASPFANASKADFTLTHEDMKFERIGDPRWLK